MYSTFESIPSLILDLKVRFQSIAIVLVRSSILNSKFLNLKSSCFVSFTSCYTLALNHDQSQRTLSIQI